MNFYSLLKAIHSTFAAPITLGARILLLRDNQVLLVKHSYQAGWYTVGGGVDKKESPRAAIERELQEEVGVTLLSPPELFAVYHSDYEKRDDYIVFYIGRDFVQKKVYSSEIEAQQWFPLGQLPQDITPATKRRIDEYLGLKIIEERW